MPRLLIVLCLAAFAAAQEREPGRGVNFYSIEKEIALGRQIAADFRRDNPILESPTALAYVESIGQRIAAEIGGPPFTYTFGLIHDAPPYNEPVALPGGFVFVPSSLILAAKDEDELAGMLAHAIAHIASRDGTRQATKAELVNIATQPLIFMGGWSGYAMREGADLAIPIGFLATWRKLELDADRLAARKMAALGYNPAALARYIGRSQQRYDEWRQNRAFSPLPPREQRIDAINAAITDLPLQNYPPHDEFRTIQDEVRRLTPLEPPRKAPTLRR